MEIENLEEKLKGTIPITREELFKLISSWGRNSSFSTTDSIYVYNFEVKKCYNLSNLDVSKIENMEDIFTYSPYNGDLSKWNVSNVRNMEFMFCYSKFNNDSLKDWNISKVRNIEFMFYKSKFNGDISNWNISNVYNFCYAFDKCPFDGDISKWQFNKNVNCDDIFSENKNFSNKYNDGKELPNNTQKFLEWFEANKNKISNLNVTKKELVDIDDYLSIFDEKELKNDKS